MALSIGCESNLRWRIRSDSPIEQRAREFVAMGMVTKAFWGLLSSEKEIPRNVSFWVVSLLEYPEEHTGEPWGILNENQKRHLILRLPEGYWVCGNVSEQILYAKFGLIVMREPEEGVTLLI